MTEQKGGISLHLAMQFPARRLIKASALASTSEKETSISKLLFALPSLVRCTIVPRPRFVISQPRRPWGRGKSITTPLGNVCSPATDGGTPAALAGLTGSGASARCGVLFSSHCYPAGRPLARPVPGLELVHPACAKFGLAVYWPDAKVITDRWAVSHPGDARLLFICLFRIALHRRGRPPPLLLSPMSSAICATSYVPAPLNPLSS